MQKYIDVHDSYNLYRSIKSIVGPSQISLNLIEDKDGNIITDKQRRLSVQLIQ